MDNAGFRSATPTTTPLPTDFHAASTYASKTAGPTAAGLDFPKVTGELWYLTKTQLWLLFLCGFFASVSRKSAALPDAPSASHKTALARALRFLKGHGHIGLTFTKQAHFTLSAFSDARLLCSRASS